ncbi:hypothetical protein D5086_004017 [Populus alba]|uniref:Uncharacterized protein n=1 Tax=Populus alba TaxID=43335 RepID=A0ACC4CQM2_POPAL
MLTFADSSTISKFIPIKISNNERRGVGWLKRAHFDIVLRRGWARLTCIEKALDLCGMVNRECGGASRGISIEILMKLSFSMFLTLCRGVNIQYHQTFNWRTVLLISGAILGYRGGNYADSCAAPTRSGNTARDQQCHTGNSPLLEKGEIIIDQDPRDMVLCPDTGNNAKSHLYHFLHGNFNTESVAGVFENKQDVVGYLTFTFMYRRPTQNPNYYNLRERVTGNFVITLSDQEASKCVLEILSSASEKAQLLIRPGEVKATVLLQAHFSTQSVSGNLALDLLEVLLSGSKIASSNG